MRRRPCNMAVNTLHISTTTRAMRAIVDNLTRSAQSGAFAACMQNAREQNDLEAYKSSFAERVDLLPIHNTRVRDDVTVEITDECYEAMRQDPSYEEWVLETIRGVVATEDPFAAMSGGNYVSMHFGATRSHYSAHSWSKDTSSSPLPGSEDDDKTYWEKRAEREEKNREITEQMAAARARLRRINEIRKIQGKQQLVSTTDVTNEIMSLLLEDFLMG